jgi:uncharacterized protein YqjF (DUF2071 family)
MARPGSEAPPLLTARWVRLAMLNYEVDPAILEPRVPQGTKLASWGGRCFVSMVGFRFVDTRLFGRFTIPFHRDFPEVNLRFYVRRSASGGEERRGVVFVKEIVPQPTLALAARLTYNENYVALPMGHEDTGSEVSYGWTHRGRRERLGLRVEGEPTVPDAGSEECFITKQDWGYSTQRDGSTLEYRVEHPPWRVWRGIDAWFDCDVASLYGAEFYPFLHGKPSSSLLADGSGVIVRQGRRLREVDLPRA